MRRDDVLGERGLHDLNGAGFPPGKSSSILLLGLVAWTLMEVGANHLQHRWKIILCGGPVLRKCERHKHAQSQVLQCLAWLETLQIERNY